jgi:hypothetical protein
MTFWFDVEDLIAHFHFASRPTGIQRLTFEIYRELGGRVESLVRFGFAGMARRPAST